MAEQFGFLRSDFQRNDFDGRRFQVLALSFHLGPAGQDERILQNDLRHGVLAFMRLVEGDHHVHPVARLDEPRDADHIVHSDRHRPMVPMHDRGHAAGRDRLGRQLGFNDRFIPFEIGGQHAIEQRHAALERPLGKVSGWIGDELDHLVR